MVSQKSFLEMKQKGRKEGKDGGMENDIMLLYRYSSLHANNLILSD